MFALIEIDWHMSEINLSFLNELELICLHTIAIVSTRLTGSKKYYHTLIILFNINNLFTPNEVLSSIAI